MEVVTADDSLPEETFSDGSCDDAVSSESSSPAASADVTCSSARDSRKRTFEEAFEKEEKNTWRDEGFQSSFTSKLFKSEYLTNERDKHALLCATLRNSWKKHPIYGRGGGCFRGPPIKGYNYSFRQDLVNGHLDRLFDAGIDMKLCSDCSVDGNTCLYEAIMWSRNSREMDWVVTRLIDKGADVNFVIERNGKKKTCLNAALVVNVGLAKILVSNGAVIGKDECNE